MHESTMNYTIVEVIMDNMRQITMQHETYERRRHLIYVTSKGLQI